MAERVQRRLAAILVADVVGYSRLMREDEAGTFAQLKTLRKELLEPKVEEYSGRIVKTTGDGVLIEFPSAVDAVQNAVDIQQAIAQRNAAVPEDRRMELRIGINVGDVIIEGDDIYGDGVNVAARLEGLAEPSGICISGSIYEQVRNKIDASFVDLGEQQVKNIAEPVRVYAVDFSHGEKLESRTVLDDADELALPDKPSIAILPFDNMSNDPDQDFLADGLAEDIITSLSKISNLFVIARNSTFSYKGTSPDVRVVARELGVRNVLEGSVQKAGNRVRITAQLVDATSGNHLWAERYDRELTDVFDLQDEITQEVTTAMQVRLTEGEQVRLRRRQTNDLAAWECYARGQSYVRSMNRQDNAQARELLQQAVELDPNFASARSLLAWIHLMDSRIVGGESSKNSMARAEEFVEQSLALDDTQPDALFVKGQIRLHQRRYDEALALGRSAVDLGPNVADAYIVYGLTLCYVGRPEEALRLADQAMRLSPFYPDYYLGTAGIAYRLLGRYEDAIATDQERLARNPNNSFSDFRLAAIYEELGRHDEARAHVTAALRKNPGLTLAQIRFSEPYSDENELEKFVGLLRKAGLPE